jgi:hypothetical protein
MAPRAARPQGPPSAPDRTAGRAPQAPRRTPLLSRLDASDANLQVEAWFDACGSIRHPRARVC